MATYDISAITYGNDTLNIKDAASRQALATKQDALNTAQMNAVNSGVTSSMLEQMDSDIDASLTLVIDAADGETKNRLKMINDDVYGRLVPEDIPGILAKYRA